MNDGKWEDRRLNGSKTYEMSENELRRFCELGAEYIKTYIELT